MVQIQKALKQSQCSPATQFSSSEAVGVISCSHRDGKSESFKAES